jgi:hypothetical protein
MLVVQHTQRFQVAHQLQQSQLVQIHTNFIRSPLTPIWLSPQRASWTITWSAAAAVAVNEPTSTQSAAAVVLVVFQLGLFISQLEQSQSISARAERELA